MRAPINAKLRAEMWFLRAGWHVEEIHFFWRWIRMYHLLRITGFDVRIHWWSQQTQFYFWDLSPLFDQQIKNTLNICHAPYAICECQLLERYEDCILHSHTNTSYTYTRRLPTTDPIPALVANGVQSPKDRREVVRKFDSSNHFATESFLNHRKARYSQIFSGPLARNNVVTSNFSCSERKLKDVSENEEEKDKIKITNNV